MDWGLCPVCEKPVRDDHAGIIAADRDGRSYHIPCWSRMMERHAQEWRERLAIQRQGLEAQRKRLDARKEVLARRKARIERSRSSCPPAPSS
jgi:hypothetical protein